MIIDIFSNNIPLHYSHYIFTLYMPYLGYLVTINLR